MKIVYGIALVASITIIIIAIVGLMSLSKPTSNVDLAIMMSDDETDDKRMIQVSR